MTPQAKGLLIVFGLAALGGLAYLLGTALWPVLTNAPTPSEPQAALSPAPQTKELEELRQQNQALAQQLNEVRTLIGDLQAAIQKADGKEREKLLKVIARLQSRVGQLELRLEAVLKRSQRQEQQESAVTTKPPAAEPGRQELEQKHPEVDWEQVAETAVKLGIGLTAACLMLVPDCPLNVARWGRQAPERPTPVLKRPQPPTFPQSQLCQSRQAGLPVAVDSKVDFRYKQTANKVVIVASPEFGRGFFQCLALTMSPQARERFYRYWPGKTIQQEVLYIKCFQYWNRSECVIPPDALQIFDEGWVFGFTTPEGQVQLHTLWGARGIKLDP